MTALRSRVAHVTILSMLATLRVLILSGSATGEDRRTDKNRLTIMTFNAEFLWDGNQPEEGQADFPWKGSATEATEHMQDVATIIINANPDIINLCEIENLDALKQLNDQHLAGRGYKPYLEQGTDTYTGQDVALLTRIDPEGSAIRYDDRTGHSGDQNKKVSKNYVARFDAAGKTISVIGLHFLARPLDESRRLQRQAQADAIRSLAMDEAAAGYQVVVLGDFNDYDGDNLDRNDSTPVSTVLSMVRGMDAAKPDDDLLNASSLAPKSERYTAFWDRNEDGQIDPTVEFTAIDHVLVHSSLASSIDAVQVPHVHDPRTHPDHFPVVVHFKFGPDSAPTGVRVLSLLPNPAGDENQNEEAKLKNYGTSAVNLEGWKLRDRVPTLWTLDSLGSIQPGEEKTIKRLGQAMGMNNSGDTIELLDPLGNVVQSVTYGSISEGDVMVAGP